MSEKYKPIIQLLNNLNLSEKDRNSFLSILLFVPDNDFQELSEQIMQNPELVGQILNSYKTKKAALENGDSDKFAQIVKDEKQMVENM